MNVSTHTTMSNVDSDPGVSMGDISTLGPRNDPRSPMSMGHLGASTLSMRAKAARKRKVNAQHNSNFRAGYVPVQEEALHRTGIRGRKRYFLYCILATLMIIAVLNVAMTAWLLYVLGMTHLGMTSVELTSVGGRDFLRVLSDAHIITMSFNDAPLGARHNSKLTIEAQSAPLELRTTPSKSGSSITFDEGNITLTTDEFCVKAKGRDDWVSANLPSLAAHEIISNIFADDVTASMIHGIKDVRDLFLESNARSVKVNSSQGINVTSGKDIHMHGISISVASKSSITVDTRHGVYFDQWLPMVTTSDPINHDLLTFKVCVCRSGQIFTVPVTRPGVSCDVGPQLQKLCGNSF